MNEKQARLDHIINTIDSSVTFCTQFSLEDVRKRHPEQSNWVSSVEQKEASGHHHLLIIIY
jgi:hypothetical protein